MQDLQQYDICKEEAKMQDSIITAQNIQITLQDSVIKLHVAKDSIQVSQFNDCVQTSKLKDESISILKQDVGRYKKITIGTIIVAVLGIILI